MVAAILFFWGGDPYITVKQEGGAGEKILIGSQEHVAVAAKTAFYGLFDPKWAHYLLNVRHAAMKKT